MNDFRQNRFPFSAAVAPVPGSEPVMFNEQCDQGTGRYSFVPGFLPVIPGFQNPPEGYLDWDPQALAAGSFPNIIETVRGAWLLQPPPQPVGLVPYGWSGKTRPLTQQWEADGDVFMLQVFTRVGMLAQPSEFPIAEAAGYAGIIMSLTELGPFNDGPFIHLGVREGENGQEACFSKWSDSLTLVSTYVRPVPAGGVFLRVLLAVDPTSEIQFISPEWSLDGWGWELIGPELLLELAGSTGFTVGFAGTSWVDAGGSRPLTVAVDSLQVLGPYYEINAQSLLRLKTQGGRNWP
jgi:hypothetical protein